MRTNPRTSAHKKRRKYIKAARGYFGGRHRLYRTAREVVERAWQFQYVHRRLRKRDMRRLWIVRINAGAHQYGVSYSKLINALKVNNIVLNRKMLAMLAFENPDAFKQVLVSAGLISK